MDPAILSHSPLFADISPEDITKLLACLGARRRAYPRDALIYHTGQKITALGIVLRGSVHIENDDVWGSRSILSRIGPGQIFAETYACLPGTPLLVSVAAAEPCEILFIDAQKLLHPCAGGCPCHQHLIHSLLMICAQKNLNLSLHSLHTSAKTIRGRLTAYLSSQAAQYGTREFDIPFDRQELADYLGVDRSALSAELGKMRRDGLLTFHRSHFRLSHDTF